MQLLFYSSTVDQDNKRLEAAVHKAVPAGRIEIFKRLNDLRERLRTPVEPDSVAVFLASSRKELRDIESLRGLLTEIYIILVLPDLNKGTIKAAHHLLPRYLSQKSGDFGDLKIVLHKMYANSQQSRNGEILSGSQNR